MPGQARCFLFTSCLALVSACECTITQRIHRPLCPHLNLEATLSRSEISVPYCHPTTTSFPESALEPSLFCTTLHPLQTCISRWSPAPSTLTIALHRSTQVWVPGRTYPTRALCRSRRTLRRPVPEWHSAPSQTMAPGGADRKAEKSYLSSAVDSINPWSGSRSSTPTPRDPPPQPVSAPTARPGDHSITHLYGQSTKSYPADCPPLNVLWYHATDVRDTSYSYMRPVLPYPLTSIVRFPSESRNFSGTSRRPLTTPSPHLSRRNSCLSPRGTREQ